MLAGYFDESGTHGRDSEAVVVAGYVGDADRWIRFNDEWAEALADYRIDYFHMKEFAAGHRKYRWGSKRQARFNRLQRIGRRAVYAGIGVVLEMRSWRRHVQSPTDHRYFGTSPYDFCATAVLGMVAKWALDQNINEGVSYTFERGASGWKQFQHTYNKCYDDLNLRKIYRMLGGLELKDKKLFPPLQTADIAAYALYQGRKEMRQRKTFGWGVKHLEQFDDLPVYVVHVDDEMFTLMKLRPEYLFVSQMK